MPLPAPLQKFKVNSLLPRLFGTMYQTLFGFTFLVANAITAGGVAHGHYHHMSAMRWVTKARKALGQSLGWFFGHLGWVTWYILVLIGLFLRDLFKLVTKGESLRVTLKDSKGNERKYFKAYYLHPEEVKARIYASDPENQKNYWDIVIR